MSQKQQLNNNLMGVKIPSKLNIKFYMGDIINSTYNLNISGFHSKRKDYKFLEQNHAYIQWLFPNHYQSKFNSRSYPLTIQQAQQFRNQKIIGQRLLISYEMFLDFMGIKLEQIETGKLGLIDAKRLKNVLITNTHNHLRIMRILACLSITGFRFYSLALISFLQHEILNQNGLFNTNENLKKIYEKKWEVYRDQNTAIKYCQIQSRQIFDIKNKVFEDQNIINTLKQRFADYYK